MRIPRIVVGNATDNAVAYTAREGGDWFHISPYWDADKHELPDSTAAVQFQSGLIFDRVLWAIGYFPWRIDPGIESSDRWQTPKPENADNTQVDVGLAHTAKPTESWKFCVNDLVYKTSGYPYPGIVTARFRALTGSERYVVMNLQSPGMYHIFNDSQLEPMSEELKRLWGMRYHFTD